MSIKIYLETLLLMGLVVYDRDSLALEVKVLLITLIAITSVLAIVANKKLKCFK